MTSERSFSLLVAATVLNGWLAGAALHRSAVGASVWQALGPEAWAQVSRGAVFQTGLAIDAILGVAAAAVTIAAALSATFDHKSHGEAPISLILAIVASLLGLLFTAKAVYLVQLVAASQPVADLQPIFNENLLWGVDCRAAADAVAFVAVVWALSGLGISASAQGPSAADAPAAAGDSVAGAAGLGASPTDR